MAVQRVGISNLRRKNRSDFGSRERQFVIGDCEGAVGRAPRTVAGNITGFKTSGDSLFRETRGLSTFPRPLVWIGLALKGLATCQDARYSSTVTKKNRPWLQSRFY